MATFKFLNRKTVDSDSLAEVRIVSLGAVMRANARVMAGSMPAQFDDVYGRHSIARPTVAEIERAGSKALRDLHAHDAKLAAG